jgi:hypothetical protein
MRSRERGGRRYRSEQARFRNLSGVVLTETLHLSMRSARKQPQILIPPDNRCSWRLAGLPLVGTFVLDGEQLNTLVERLAQQQLANT